MILFLDRSVGKGLGRTLRRIKGFPATVETHDAHFAQGDLYDSAHAA